MNLELLVLGGGMAASLVAWVVVVLNKWSADEWLAYEPRQRVPWHGFVGGIAVVFLAAMVLSASVDPPEAANPPPKPSAESFASMAVQQTIVTLALVAFGMIALSATGATRPDFGLPSSFRQAGNDGALGLLVALLAIAPVYLLMLLLGQFLGEQEQHPTLQLVNESPTWGVLLAGLCAASVGAPVFEEFLFRVLLQGWAEKVEDETLDWRATERTDAVATTEKGEPTVEVVQRDDAAPNPFASPAATGRTQAVAQEASGVEVDQAARKTLISVGALPHGWAPVLLSSVLFAVAHANIGFTWAPLFLFAVMLGYVYQRTHRVLPCVVAHMAFNTLSLLMVWGAARFASE